MAKIEFGAKSPSLAPEVAPAATAAVPAPEAQNSTTALATVPPPQPPARSQGTFCDDENIDPGDLVIPRLNIVQKVGEMSNIHTPGSIVLDGRLVLADAPKASDKSKPVEVIVLGLRPKQYVEKVEGGLRGNLFNTPEEVVAKGGTLDYTESKALNKPLYQTLVTALCFVAQPEGVDAASFPYEFDGKRYALSLYSMKGTSYTNAAKPLMTARKIGHLRTTGYRGGAWKLSSQLKKFQTNFAFVPVLEFGTFTTPEFQTWTRELLGF